MARDFYLVQRVCEGWNDPDVSKDLGGYRAEYMGSAEFEFGAMPQSFRALRDAKEIEVGSFMLSKRPFTAVWIKSDGNPAEDLQKWVDGGCRGKESAHLLDVIEGKRDKYNDTVIWWALEENVIFGENGGPHIAAIIHWIKNRRGES